MKLKHLYIYTFIFCVFCGSHTVLADYTDVTQNTWYYETIEQASILGLMEGNSNKRFEPEANMSNIDFVTSVLKLADTDKSNNISEIDYAIKCGYVLEGEISDINAPITRQRIAKIISRVLQLPETDEDSISDKINDWEDTCPKCKDAIARCYTYEIMNGYEDGLFRGRYPATRSEIAAVLINAYNYMEVKDK